MKPVYWVHGRRLCCGGDRWDSRPIRQGFEDKDHCERCTGLDVQCVMEVVHEHVSRSTRPQPPFTRSIANCLAQLGKRDGKMKPYQLRCNLLMYCPFTA